jgi:hypothetical protein
MADNEEIKQDVNNGAANNDVWVEEPATAVTVAAAADAPSPDTTEDKDWETSDAPVGLTDGNPLVVASIKEAMIAVEGAEVFPDARVGRAVAVTRVNLSEAPVPDSYEERSIKECTFKPDLSISSEKMRNKASSHHYGSATVVVKPSPQPELPAFKPDINVSKIATKRRESAGGSQYGKMTPGPKKIPAAETPDFKPHLVESKKAKALRDGSAPRIYETAKKYCDKGKKARADVVEAKKAMEPSKFSLYSDRPTTAPETGSWQSTEFTVDNLVVAQKNPLLLRSVEEMAPIKGTKYGEKLKAKAASRYAKDAYTPPKAARKDHKVDPNAWKNAVSCDAPPPAEQLSAPKNKKTETATSNYSPQVYKPARGERPMTAPLKTAKFNLRTLVDSPLDNDASQLPVPKSKKYTNVRSSGYGVVSPASSIPAKVHSYKHRSAANQIRTNSFRASDNNGRDSAQSNEENEHPDFDSDSLAKINDLIEKAASLDPAATNAAGEEQLTML